MSKTTTSNEQPKRKRTPEEIIAAQQADLERRRYNLAVRKNPEIRRVAQASETLSEIAETVGGDAGKVLQDAVGVLSQYEIRLVNGTIPFGGE